MSAIHEDYSGMQTIGSEICIVHFFRYSTKNNSRKVKIFLFVSAKFKSKILYKNNCDSITEKTKVWHIQQTNLQLRFH